MSYAQRETHPRSAVQAKTVRRGLESPSHSLDDSTRRAMGPRFGHDFSRVRIHTGPEAAASARTVRARAYAVGNDVVFAQDQYNPATRQGQHLLAHELTHVAQQAASPIIQLQSSTPAQEAEADRLSAHAVAGRAVKPQQAGGPALARFSDNNHHIIEQAALEDSGLSPEQIQAVEQGNTQRDYSQTPKALNLALLGKYSNFGNYHTWEHFDNYIFDTKTDRWRSRGAGPNKFMYLDPRHPDFSPISYIAEELNLVAKGNKSTESLVHLGNAFHTIEDFFAHSNFMELMQGDKRFGEDLLTGSFGGEAANSTVSLDHTLAGIAPPTTRTWYEQRSAEAEKHTEQNSHSHLAKDTAASPGFEQARRLAALVIQDLAANVNLIMSTDDPDQRPRLMQEIVLGKIAIYLRPPDRENPWWEKLLSRGSAAMDARIAKVQQRTPVTANQWPISPLRNMEASKDSPLAMPFGAAFSLGKYGFLQAGVGVKRPGSLDPVPPLRNPTDTRSPFVGGVQWTGKLPGFLQ